MFGRTRAMVAAIMSAVHHCSAGGRKIATCGPLDDALGFVGSGTRLGEPQSFAILKTWPLGPPLHTLAIDIAVMFDAEYL